MSDQERVPTTRRLKIEETTYFWDRLRGISAGINDAVFSTFILLICIRVFDASSTQKSIVASALWIGMFLMPVFLWLASYFRFRCNIACVIYTSTTALCFTASMFFKSTEYFIGAVTLSMIIGVQGFTLLPRILAENYRPEIRGKRVGTTVMIGGLVFLFCSLSFGYLMDASLDNYIWVLGSAAAAYYAVAFFYFHIPSPRLKRPKSRFPYHTIQLFWKNPHFAKLSLLWSLLEFGNYMMIPIRMEFLANEVYGMNLTNSQITWLFAMLPMIIALISSRTWGRFFDMFRLETTQALIGGLLIVSTLLFFVSTNYWVMLLSMAIFGLSHGAQKIHNHLWITKVVPKHTVADYISAFSILNGFRGILAPVTAYWILSMFQPAAAANIALVVIAVGTIALLFARKSITTN
ncbi:MAG: MFS transporter [Opitutales bacterium]|nr:MFS transporter [Opitutales bacterium]